MPVPRGLYLYAVILIIFCSVFAFLFSFYAEHALIFSSLNASVKHFINSVKLGAMLLFKWRKNEIHSFYRFCKK